MSVDIQHDSNEGIWAKSVVCPIAIYMSMACPMIMGPKTDHWLLPHKGTDAGGTDHLVTGLWVQL